MGTDRSSEAALDSAAQLDTTIDLFTPEHVQFSYRLAGLASRALAYGVDMVVKLTLCGLVGLILRLFNAFGWGFLLVTLFFLEWCYFIVFEIYWNGQTPGKRCFGLRVISADGTPLTWQQSVVRNLLRPADQIPFVYVVGGAAAILSSRGQRLGDLAAGTMVILGEQYSRPPEVEKAPPEVEALLKQLPGHLHLSRELREAVLLYGLKHRTLSRSLRHELAAPLLPCLQNMAALPEPPEPDLIFAALYHLIHRSTSTTRE